MCTTWPRSPGINVATHKSQFWRLPGYSKLLAFNFRACLTCFASVQKAAPCCAQGPVHCLRLYKCFCAACDCQDSNNSTGFLAAFETSVVPLVLCSILRAVGLHGFCLPDSVMYEAIFFIIYDIYIYNK